MKIMAYNEKIVNRIREALIDIPDVEEKKMFRGITFMVDGKMCISVGKDNVMFRIDPVLHDIAAERFGATSMKMKGREYKGYINVTEEGIKSKKDFDYWIGLSLDFNSRAKASPKKKK